ncbi:MAG: polyprenyl synthetase family protein [Planctomycetota bacterium]
MLGLLPRIESALDAACQFGPGCPDRLGDAIRYSLLAPGKRLRPALVLMAAEACGGCVDDAMPGAVAVEMIHAYSLIHDDLPAMDDDDLRRGRPTTHIEFDEATAILAGDALQPMAMSHLSHHVSDPQRGLRAIQILSVAAGPEHLVGGQADDLAAESGRLPEAVLASKAATESVARDVSEPDAGPNRSGKQSAIHRAATNQAAVEFLESIHRRKTGALFAASLELGAVLAGANDAQRQTLADYATDLGLAFQVVDDLLDHTSSEAQLGKRTGKDVDRGKLTYPGLLGIQQARDKATQLIASARSHADVLGPTAWRLTLLADFVLRRSH